MQILPPFIIGAEKLSNLVETELLGQAIFLLIIDLFFPFLNGKEFLNAALEFNHRVNFHWYIIVFTLIDRFATDKS